MNIYDISKAAGVSIATVSRVLNGNGKVSPQTKENVLRVMREYDYTPNAFARGLGLGSMRTIGIMCADVSDLYLSEAVYHIEQAMRSYEYDSLLCCTGYDLQNKQKYLKLLLSKKVDAVVLIGSHYVEADEHDNDYIRKAAEGVPIFLMNGFIRSENIYCTMCNEASASHELAQLLISKGSKAPVLLYRINSFSTRRKISGVYDACSKAGLPFGEERRIQCPRGIEPTVQAIAEAANTVNFDAIICSDDLLAVSALKYAKAAGLRVPEDIRVTGYNDSILAQSTTPLLTSVDNKMFALCRATAENLVIKLAGENISPQTVVSAELKIRQSI